MQISDKQQKALIAMSGGVDSSVAALLAQRLGYECVGVTMDLLGTDILSASCAPASAQRDVEDARAVCDQLGIPHYVVDLTAEFKEHVVETFVATYEEGKTPNPCIECNRYLKFGALIQYARDKGFDRLVSGHYARIEHDVQRDCYLLKTGTDTHKDQSYVLYSLTQDQLAFTLLPLGDLTKEEVRALAVEQGFSVAQREESQDICFVPDGDHVAFIRRWRGKIAGEHVSTSGASASPALSPGPIVDEQGLELGMHEGIVNFTIGQRKRIGISTAVPLYVKRIDAATNTVVVAPREHLKNTLAFLEDVNFICDGGGDNELFSESTESSGSSLLKRALAKHRYRCAPQYVKTMRTGPHSLKVRYEESIPDLTCGQALVLYGGVDNKTLLAGGTIVCVE